MLSLSLSFCRNDVHFVVFFDCLETLVLDHNLIDEETAFPRSGGPSGSRLQVPC